MDISIRVQRLSLVLPVSDGGCKRTEKLIQSADENDIFVICFSFFTCGFRLL
jgi:hypothetical protein